MEVAVFPYVCHLREGSKTRISIPCRDQDDVDLLRRIWVGDERRVVKKLCYFVHPGDLWTVTFRKFLRNKPKRHGLWRVRTFGDLVFLNACSANLIAVFWAQKGNVCGFGNAYFTEVSQADDIPF